MKLLPHELARLVHQAIQSAQTAGDLPAFDIPDIDVRPSKRADQGDYGVAVMALTKPAKMNPFEIAKQIAIHFDKPDFIAAVEVAAPGYINFRIDEGWLRQQVETIIAEGKNLFALDLGAGKRAQVEFVSANPTGPVTVGRTRGAVVGDTMARLLETAGFSVEREYYFNNAGAQMRNLGNSLRLRYLDALGHAVTIPGKEDKTFYQGVYLIDIAKQLIAEQGDTLANADWQPFKEYAEKSIFEMIRASLRRISVQHDVYFNENSLYESGAIWKVLEELDERGYTYKAKVRADATPEEIAEVGGKGEAVWFQSTKLGDVEDRVLVKSSGEPTYTLPDIAYHVNKLERGFDLLVNILGSDHHTEHQVVKYGITALDMDVSKIRVILHQMVKIKKPDGTTGRGRTRTGDYDELDDLVDATSPDAVRYMLLNRSTDSDMVFDIDLAVKQSNENPVYYIQYAHVRCAGIFREAAARGVTDDGADLKHLGEAELRFLRKVLELGEVIELTVHHMEPHRIAFYALELANLFHPIFDNVRVLHSEVPPEVAKARLRFFRAAQVVLKRVLRLMGMTAPEVM